MLEAKTATRMLQKFAGTQHLFLTQLEGTLPDLNRPQILVALRLLIAKDLVTLVPGKGYVATEKGSALNDTGSAVLQGPYPAPYVDEPSELVNHLQQRSWNAMRVQSTFTASEIVILAANEDDETAADTIARYLRDLCKAGYLHVFPKRVRRCKRYRLLDDTGELSPVVRKDGVYDRNRKELRV